MQIERVETSGQGPGWIYNHQAMREGDAGIRIFGGNLIVDGALDEADNPKEFLLDLATYQWQLID